jgi:hypothetical protein
MSSVVGCLLSMSTLNKDDIYTGEKVTGKEVRKLGF